MRPTWAEVSLKNLRRNFRNIHCHVGGGVTICAVLKGDASGHGAVECARALAEEGATWFGVTSTEEGVRLRDAGITGRILLLSGFWKGEEEEVVNRRLTPAVWEQWHIQTLARAVKKTSCPSFSVHLKIDTGLTRLGISCAALPGLLRILKDKPELAVEGVYTHLASAEVLDAADVGEQMSRFEAARDIVLEAGFFPTYFHMANSAAVATRAATWKNMVRPGISLFGYSTVKGNSVEFSDKEPDIAPVLSWKSRIISLKEVGANERVGYNGTFVTRTRTRLAVLPVGFADGLSRQLSSRGQAIVGDAFAPIVGLIAMDITLLDVTSVKGVSLGDEIVLIGESESCSITAWDHAVASQTVPDEVLCGIAKRVPRRYIY